MKKKLSCLLFTERVTNIECVCVCSTLSYSNFTFGKSNLQKPVQHSVTVKYLHLFD